MNPISRIAKSKLRWLIPTLAIIFIFLSLNRVRETLIAVARGEKFYAGHPTSYWRSQLMKDLYYDPSTGSSIRAGFQTQENTGRLQRWLPNCILDCFGEPPLPCAGEDVNIIPVMCDLLQDSDVRMRSFVIRYLGAFGSEARAAVPRLIELLDDKRRNQEQDWFTVSELAAATLRMIDPATARALGLRAAKGKE